MRLWVISIAFTKYEAIDIKKKLNEETDLLVWKQKVKKKSKTKK